jgi:hypothetical protein
MGGGDAIHALKNFLSGKKVKMNMRMLHFPYLHSFIFESRRWNGSGNTVS